MFWRMTGLSNAAPVDTILDKENFTLEELLEEDEIIQECKALNGRLINFLRGRAQVEQLIRYIVEEAPMDAKKNRSFKFPFIACEIFTCEVDIILKTLVEDNELMDMLFSFLGSDHSHSMLLAGYFSKVVICLLLRKTVPFMHYIQVHQEIFKQLVDLIGITSIMEVLIRLVGVDEYINTNYMEAVKWLEDIDILEMIVEKFSSSDSPEVHANAAETLCAITRCAPPGLSAKISSPGFIGRLFRHALDDSQPKSVLINTLFVCIALLDPKRMTFGAYMFNRQLTHESSTIASSETVEGMLESLGDLLKLLEISATESVLITTYGTLQPPLGKKRLKIVEFVSVLLTVGRAAAEKELIRLGAIRRMIDLFFEYPYNNFMHHHVENIIVSCLESKNTPLIQHLLHDCNLVGKILEAEKNSTLATDTHKPTVPAEGRTLPRIGNIGHMTRISNKLVQLGNNNIEIQAYLQENSEWVDWHENVLHKRNSVENVSHWACGRPTALHDRMRDSDDDDYQDRDYDVAALANNLSQAFQCGIYDSNDMNEAHVSLERDDEDVYFDDESAEVVISSLRLGDTTDGSLVTNSNCSLVTNSNWSAFEDNQLASGNSTESPTSPTPDTEGTTEIMHDGDDEDIAGQDNDLVESAISSSETEKESTNDISDDVKETSPEESEKSTEWVQWRETSDSSDQSDLEKPSVMPDMDLVTSDVDDSGTTADSLPSTEALKDEACDSNTSELPEPTSGSEKIILPDENPNHEKDKTVEEAGE